MKLAVALGLFAATVFAQGGKPECGVAPGWTQSGAARMYEGDNLYDYMNGNSEGYLIYGFRIMHGVTCKQGDAQFVFDISEFPDGEMAYGMFASNRDPRLPLDPLGMAGQIAPQRGIFAKGNRFVEISASPASVDHSAALRTFLKAVDAKLDGATALPAQLGWFPAESLDKGTLRLIPQSVLGLSLLKRGYLAKYDYGRAFLVGQANQEAAAQVLAKLKQRFGETQPAALGDEAFSANDKYLGRMLVFRKGNYVAGFVNLTDGADASAPAKAFAANIR